MEKKFFAVTYRTAVLYEPYRMIVEAKNKKEARILGQAQRICRGLPFAVAKIREMKAKHE